MKVVIDVDELYPFYEIYRVTEIGLGKEEIELPLDKVKWIERVMSEFEDVQDYLRQFDKVDYTL